MATMNLRLSSKSKSKDGGGGGDRKPETLEPDLGDIEQISKESLHLFQPILTADSLSTQISNIKNLFKSCSADCQQILSIVSVQWWFQSDLTSPVRKAITGCLNQIKDENFNKLVVEQLSLKIRSDCGEDFESDEVVMKTIKNINRCLDNFKSGEMAVTQEIKTVVPFLQEKLQEKIESLCEEDVTPVDKSSLTDEALQIIRVLVSVTKGKFESLLPENRAEIQSFMLKIAYHKTLPLDLRSNAGIVYVGSVQDQDQIFCLLDVEQANDENLGAKLCFAHGVLSCFTNSQLAGKCGSESSVMIALLSMYLRISKMNNDTGVVLGCSRGLLTWCNKLADLGKQGQVSHSDKFYLALDYTWNHFEHQIDSVRHNTKDFLTSLLQVLKSCGEDGEKCVDKYLDQALSLPAHKKARFPALSCLIKSGGLEKILEKKTNFRCDILQMSEEYALVGPITDLYENIIKVDHKQNKDNLAVWYKNTVHPIVSQLMVAHNLGSSQLSKSLLNKCGKLAPNLVELIFTEEKGISGKPALYCLKLGRELGVPWKFDKHRSLLQKSIRSVDLDEKLQTISLLAESHSSVETFSKSELDLIQEFLSENLSMTSPAGRHELNSHCKKIFNRIKDGVMTLQKKLTMPKFEKDYPTFKETIIYYDTFLNNVCDLLFQNMFEGANFARRGIVLDILTLLHEIFRLDILPSWLNLKKSINSAAAQSLYAQLYDSYENNKMKALDVLRCLPPHLLGLSNFDRVRKLLDEATQLICSNKPSSCLTAGYLFKLLLTAPAAPCVLADKLSLIKAEERRTKFYAVVYVRNLLAKQLHAAQCDLLQAAALEPMYGALHVIRSFYAELTTEEIDNEWVELTKDLVELGYDVWKVVAPVVASDSPEGHLPMDDDTENVKKLQKLVNNSLSKKQPSASFMSKSDSKTGMKCKILDPHVISDVFPDEIAEDILEDIISKSLGEESDERRDSGVSCNGDVGHDGQEQNVEAAGKDDTASLDEPADMSETGLVKAREVSSQMLLLCAWRSVKELSLLLGELCQHHLNPLLTTKQILDIASFLMDLLSQTKHRGAFEQAYVAFTQLCSCLWSSSRAALHSHPSQLLTQLLASISGNKKYSNSSKSGLCATRRSAGVPFIVQAIVSTDPDPTNSVFKDAMQELISLAMNTNCDQEIRVHAMNILRALFKDTRLGECVTGFVERGIKVSITGFKASNWAERNAATLLFSALITRIFGVKREKDGDELSAKNCLTGRVFFHRYPGLHEFLLACLQECVPDEQAGTLELFPMLYPLLLLLSRLFPAPSESLDNPYKLSVFIPLVEKCSASPVLAIRVLASKALVALLPKHKIDEFGRKVIDRLEEDSLSSNLRHGLLLQLYQLKRSSPGLSLQTDRLLDRLLTECRCPLISSQYLDILLLDESFDKETCDKLESILPSIVFDSEISLKLQKHIWGPLFLQKCSELYAKISLKCEGSGVLMKLLIHPELEVRLKALNLYEQYTRDPESKQVMTKEDAFNIILCEPDESCLALLIKICTRIKTESFKLPDLAYILSLIQVKQSEDVLCNALVFSSRVFGFLEPESSAEYTGVYSDLCQTLKTFSGTEQHPQLRQAVVQALLETPSLLLRRPGKSVQEKSAYATCWSAYLDLIYDDEDDIRLMCSQVNHKLSGELVTGDLLARSAVQQCVRHLGLCWPAAAVMTVLGHVITLAFDCDQDVDADTDKAFDKGEMNTYRELQTTCTNFLPVLRGFLSSMSPKLLQRTAVEQLPSQLVAKLLPCLPGSVVVYSLAQLSVYSKSFSEDEKTVKTLFSHISSTLKPLSLCLDKSSVATTGS